MNDRNIGKFSILAIWVNENPQAVADVFKKLNFVPVRAEYMYLSDTIDYEGISDQFEEVQKGEPVPQYDLTVIEDDETKELQGVEVIRVDKVVDTIQ